MSISSAPQPIPELKRERLLKKSSIKKVIEKTTQLFTIDPINILMILFSVISGIGELIGAELSWKWYLLFFMVTLIFAFDKESKNNKENIIVNEERSK